MQLLSFRKNSYFLCSKTILRLLLTYTNDIILYFFRKVNISENQDLSIKLKYDPPKTASGAIGSWVIWVIIAAVVAFIVVTGVVGFIVFKKQKFNK